MLSIYKILYYLYFNLRIRESLRLFDYNKISKRRLQKAASRSIVFSLQEGHSITPKLRLKLRYDAHQKHELHNKKSIFLDILAIVDAPVFSLLPNAVVACRIVLGVCHAM